MNSPKIAIMNKIDKVRIDGFWIDKTVEFKLKDDVNFLIGVNGSGKTTIINLVAATLNADFATLDRFQFKKIRVDLKDIVDDPKKKTAFIEVEKTEKTASPYPNIIFKIKRYNEKEPKKYLLDELEEEHLIRYPNEYVIHRRARSGQSERDVNIALKELVNVTWLSIHRTNSYIKRREERSFESTIDQKIEELQNELIKYFSQLNRKYSVETDSFQKFIFESLLDTESQEDLLDFTKTLDAEKEKRSLKEIFSLFRINENTINKKLEAYFQGFETSLNKLNRIGNEGSIFLNDLSFFLGIRRIHSVVQEWTLLVQKQKKINQPKDIFLKVINDLLQRKELFINERNELMVRTQSGKIFSLTNLSSGEKQLLIILSQSLLQESNAHIYIADEPELSLHVEWQEKLVSSLQKLNPNSQIIFATHSPDIVGEFNSSVIKVEEVIA